MMRAMALWQTGQKLSAAFVFIRQSGYGLYTPFD